LGRREGWRHGGMVKRRWGRAVADWSCGGLKGKGEEAAGRRSFIFLVRFTH